MLVEFDVWACECGGGGVEEDLWAYGTSQTHFKSERQMQTPTLSRMRWWNWSSSKHSQHVCRQIDGMSLLSPTLWHIEWERSIKVEDFEHPTAHPPHTLKNNNNNKGKIDMSLSPTPFLYHFSQPHHIHSILW